jgi:hypothetical protein
MSHITHLIHPDRRDVTLCGVSKEGLRAFIDVVVSPDNANCPICRDLYRYDLTGELDDEPDAIDVKAIAYADKNGIKTTPADILRNYLIGKTIAHKSGKTGTVIDAHMPAGMRAGITVILDNGQSFILYLPTQFEIVQQDISQTDVTPYAPRDMTISHVYELMMFALIGAVVGASLAMLAFWK